MCIARNTTHGKSRTKVHVAWQQMRQRCEDPNSTAYHKYGAKGILVCERWKKFENFYADMGEPPTAKHTLDRIDFRGNYEPGNCRWATQLEQQNNRSSNRLLTAFGRTQTLQQWVRETGMSHKTITCRIDRNGWSAEKALSVPPVIGRNQYG